MKTRKSWLVTGCASIQNGATLDGVRRPLVVVGGRAVVGADLDPPAGEPHHLAPGSDRRPARGPRPRRLDAHERRVRRAALELERLEDGLVVLVLVLQHHLVDEAVAKQRVGGVEVGGDQAGRAPGRGSRP